VQLAGHFDAGHGGVGQAHAFGRGRGQPGDVVLMGGRVGIPEAHGGGQGFDGLPEQGFGGLKVVAQLFLGAPPVGDVLHGPFVEHGSALAVADAPDMEGGPELGVVGPDEFHFQAPGHADGRQGGLEKFPVLGMEKRGLGGIRGFGQGQGGGVAKHAGRGPVGRDESPGRGHLEEAFHGVFENAAIFFFGLGECPLGAFFRSDIAQVAEIEPRTVPTFDTVGRFLDPEDEPVAA